MWSKLLSWIVGFGTDKLLGGAMLLLIILAVLCSIQTYRISLWRADYAELDKQYNEAKTQLELSETNNKQLDSTLKANNTQYKAALQSLRESLDTQKQAFEQYLSREKNRYEILLKAGSVAAKPGEVADEKTDEAFRKSINSWIGDWNAGNRMRKE